jgi:hypothetical protein
MDIASKPDRQKADELRVFRRFAAVAPLGIFPDSIQERESPDIQCLSAEHGAIGFEMVEIVDCKLPRADGSQQTFLKHLRDASAQYQLAALDGTDVSVTLAGGVTNAQRKVVIPGLLTLLQSLPAGFGGVVPLQHDAALSRVVLRLYIRRVGTTGRPRFGTGGGVSVEAPIVQCIERKFKKAERAYETADRLELVAFYERHPADLAEYRLVEVDEFVRHNLPVSRFSRVWVFDSEDIKVIYRSDLFSAVACPVHTRTGLGCPQCRQAVATMERVSSGLLMECPDCGNRWSWSATKPH